MTCRQLPPDVKRRSCPLMDNKPLKVRPASRCRPPHPPSDTEMAEGGSCGGRPVEEHGDGHTAGFGGLTAAGEYLSALCVRPVGGCLAQEVRARGGDCRSLCGRQCTRISASGRRRSFPEGIPGTVTEVWVGTSPRENAPDRVREICLARPETKRRRQAGNI